MGKISFFSGSFSFKINRTPLRVVGDILSIIGLLIYTQMLYFYSKHQAERYFNPYLIYATISTFFASIITYSYLYFKLIFKKNPVRVVPVERWFTIYPYKCILCIVFYVLSFFIAVITLWPVFGVYGMVYSFLLYAFLFQLTDYIPY